MPYRAEIPYGCYWSTPFARWQGAYANLNSLELAAEVARKELDARGIPKDAIDHGVLGFSVPQKHSFYGLPWVAGMAGLRDSKRAGTGAESRRLRANRQRAPRRRTGRCSLC